MHLKVSALGCLEPPAARMDALSEGPLCLTVVSVDGSIAVCLFPPPSLPPTHTVYQASFLNKTVRIGSERSDLNFFNVWKRKKRRKAILRRPHNM